MSFLSSLFNRKERSEYAEESKRSADVPVTEDEYLEDEDLEDDTSEKDSLTEEEEAALEDNDDTNVEYEVVEREIHPAKIICPDCGGITLEGLDFCDKCGGELL